MNPYTFEDELEASLHLHEMRMKKVDKFLRLYRERNELNELVVGNPPPAAMDKDIATNAKPKTDTRAKKEIKEKPVNNEVIINPKEKNQSYWDL